MNKNEIGTIITTLRSVDHDIFLCLAHLDDLNADVSSYQEIEDAYALVREIAGATEQAIKHMQQLQERLRK